MSADRIPILKIGPYLLASIQVELHDRLALEFTEQLSDAVIEHGSRGALIDISAIDIVDTFMGRTLRDLASVLSVLAAQTVIVGMRPQVAITLTELGVTLDGLWTALDVEHGVALLTTLVEQNGTNGAHAA